MRFGFATCETHMIKLVGVEGFEPPTNLRPRQVDYQTVQHSGFEAEGGICTPVLLITSKVQNYCATPA